MALLWREHGARSWVLNEEQKQKIVRLYRAGASGNATGASDRQVRLPTRGKSSEAREMLMAQAQPRGTA
jgi:hypothetical protein